MSATPRTDAEATIRHTQRDEQMMLNSVSLNFARTLETELNAALEREKKLREALTHYTRNGPLKKDAWIEAFDDFYGRVLWFRGHGGASERPWKIAEEALQP